MSQLWLRNEIKLHEKRTPLIPKHANELIKLGHRIYIESSQTRIFADETYHEQGCELVSAGSWPYAPKDAFILGLKNIGDHHFPLMHRHIYFAHAYNEKRIFSEKHGITTLMERYKQGGGSHYDFEFLLDANNKRVTTFGNIAGLIGAALTIMLYAQIQRGFTSLYLYPFFENMQSMYHLLNFAWHAIRSQPPKIAIIGANGRCGTGVRELLAKYQIAADEWGKNDILLKNNTSFTEYDILFNCAYVQDKISPFLTIDQLNKHCRLKLIADISCETSGNNPIPLYSGTTYHAEPTHQIFYDMHLLHIMAIDHLPTFLPRESSIDFSTQCLPYYKLLLNNEKSLVWQKARGIFEKHIKTLSTSSRRML